MFISSRNHTKPEGKNSKEFPFEYAPITYTKHLPVSRPWAWSLTPWSPFYKGETCRLRSLHDLQEGTGLEHSSWDPGVNWGNWIRGSCQRLPSSAVLLREESLWGDMVNGACELNLWCWVFCTTGFSRILELVDTKRKTEPERPQAARAGCIFGLSATNT